MTSATDLPVEPLGIRALTEVLIKHHGLTSGMYDLAVEFQFGAGAFGPSPEAVLPSLFVSISRIGLQRTEKESVHTVDAAKVNPPPKGRSKK